MFVDVRHQIEYREGGRFRIGAIVIRPNLIDSVRDVDYPSKASLRVALILLGFGGNRKLVGRRQCCARPNDKLGNDVVQSGAEIVHKLTENDSGA